MSSTGQQNELLNAIGEIAGDIKAIKERLETLEDISRTNTEVLTGNGTPDKGVIVRLSNTERDLKRILAAFWVVAGATVTATLAYIARSLNV